MIISDHFFPQKFELNLYPVKGVVGFFQRDNAYVGYYLFINPSREHGANFPNCGLDGLLYASHTHTVDVSQLHVRAMSRVEDMIFFPSTNCRPCVVAAETDAIARRTTRTGRTLEWLTATASWHCPPSGATLGR